MTTPTTRQLMRRTRPRRVNDDSVSCLLEVDEEASIAADRRSGHVANETVEPMNGSDTAIGSLIELLLKGRRRLDLGIRNATLQRLLLPRLLAISLASFLLYGVAMVFVFNAAGVWPTMTALDEVIAVAETGKAATFLEFTSDSMGHSHWLTGSAWHLMLAYAIGLIAATGICLPSLYFYGLLAGVKMSMRDVVIHSLRAKATSAIALIGILPMYAAIVMGVVILGGPADANGPYPILTWALWLGLILPFLGGLFGTWTLHRGFPGLCDTLPLERRARRECFLRRLTLSWSAVYTAVSPVMIFTLWEYLERF